jgi:hypothetical protein
MLTCPTQSTTRELSRFREPLYEIPLFVLPASIARVRIAHVTDLRRIDEAQRRRIGKMNAHLVGDVAQRIIKMRQMTAGEIAHERALNFIIADAAMQPSQKKRELHESGNEYCDP